MLREGVDLISLALGRRMVPDFAALAVCFSLSATEHTRGSSSGLSIVQIAVHIRSIPQAMPREREKELTPVQITATSVVLNKLMALVLPGPKFPQPVSPTDWTQPSRAGTGCGALRRWYGG